jgi:FlaA1/EpsC-like NDP-sugar epimerase
MSKYICEQMVLSYSNAFCDDSGKNSPVFVVVRFGNVLGSRGSIVPLFQQQIEKGGPVTITHPDITRYFMTISEACSLVLKTGGVGENGGLYLLDMGEPVRIRDLAEQLIRFQGYEPETEIKIEYIGLRPGEKLDESLLSENEMPSLTEYSRILKISQKDGQTLDVKKLLDDLRPVCQLDPAKPEAYRNTELLSKILKNLNPN